MKTALAVFRQTSLAHLFTRSQRLCSHDESEGAVSEKLTDFEFRTKISWEFSNPVLKLHDLEVSGVAFFVFGFLC